MHRSLYDGVVHQVYAALTCVVVASPLPEAAWYSAAEAALTALYALHPSPEHLSAAVLKRLARTAFASQAGAAEEEEQDTAAGGKGAEAAAAEEEEQGADAMDADDAEGAPAEGEDAEAQQPAADKAGAAAAAPAASQQTGSQAARSMHSVVALSRFFFVLGHVALQHLVRRQTVTCEGAAVLTCAGALPCGLGWLPCLARERAHTNLCLHRLSLYVPSPSHPTSPTRSSSSAPPRRCAACGWSARRRQRRSGRSGWPRGAPPVGSVYAPSKAEGVCSVAGGVGRQPGR